MKKEPKDITYSFSLFLLVMNSVFMGLELDRLFRQEQNLKTYGTSSTISESAALEMQNINQLRESIQSWVFIISLGLFLIFIYKFNDQLSQFFNISIVMNVLFFLIAIIFSVVFPFHIIETSAVLSVSLLMSFSLGILLLIKTVRGKYTLSKI